MKLRKSFSAWLDDTTASLAFGFGPDEGEILSRADCLAALRRFLMRGVDSEDSGVSLLGVATSVLEVVRLGRT